ncbi:MAG: hypothetical protein LBH19_02285 [Dysgonamonadaceae bacterium]|jgi:PBP1b-binding outer membrane lipoprotein LpoB|nr:hypothetical protein [Dysgonamonadaceae bacterium]
MKTRFLFILLSGLICGCANEPEEKQSLTDEINQQFSGIQLRAGIATFIAELSDGILFIENLNSSYRYAIIKNTLKLYHSGMEYVLLKAYENDDK